MFTDFFLNQALQIESFWNSEQFRNVPKTLNLLFVYKTHFHIFRVWKCGWPTYRVVVQNTILSMKHYLGLCNGYGQLDLPVGSVLNINIK